MENIVGKISNSIGAVILATTLVVALIIMIPVFVALSIGVLFLYDENGVRKYKSATQFIEAVSERLQGIVR